MSKSAVGVKRKKACGRVHAQRSALATPSWLRAEVDRWFEGFMRDVRASALGLDGKDRCVNPVPLREP